MVAGVRSVASSGKFYWLPPDKENTGKRGGEDHKQNIMDLSFTASSPKVWPPLINSHSFMKALTNQKSRKLPAGF